MFTILPIKGFIDQIEGFHCDGIHAGLKPNGNASYLKFSY